MKNITQLNWTRYPDKSKRYLIGQDIPDNCSVIFYWLFYRLYLWVLVPASPSAQPQPLRCLEAPQATLFPSCPSVVSEEEYSCSRRTQRAIFSGEEFVFGSKLRATTERKLLLWLCADAKAQYQPRGFESRAVGCLALCGVLTSRVPDARMLAEGYSSTALVDRKFLFVRDGTLRALH